MNNIGKKSFGEECGREYENENSSRYKLPDLL
jgi:hypothetical protein